MRTDLAYLYTLDSGTYLALAPIILPVSEGRQRVVFLTPAADNAEHSLFGQVDNNTDAGADLVLANTVQGESPDVPFVQLTREAVEALTPDQCPARDWILSQGDTTDEIQNTLIQAHVPDEWVAARLKMAAAGAPG